MNLRGCVAAALVAALFPLASATADERFLPKMLAPGAAAANLGFNPLNPANNLGDLPSVATARSNLGLGSIAILNSIAGANLSAGAAAANLGFAPLNPANNLSEILSASAARANLGLGPLATLNTVDLTANVTGTLPGTNGGTGLTAFSRSGTTTTFLTSTGTLTSGHCSQFDSNGNIVDSGAGCGGASGGGSGTVNNGTANALAYYPSTGNSVSPLTLGSGVLSALGTTPNANGGIAILTASGVLPSGQFPALTGDVTSSAGSLTTSIASGAVTSAKLASGAAAANLGFTPLRPSNNLSDIADAATARANLGISGTGGGGTAASALTGSTLASGITTSSLTSVGTLGSLTVSGTSSLATLTSGATTTSSLAVSGGATISGSLGVGTSSPVDALDVYTLGNTTFQIFGTGSPANYRGGLSINTPAAGAFNIGSYTNIPVVLMTQNAERARLTSAGNFGVGVTAPAARFAAGASTSAGNDVSYAIHAVDAADASRRLALGYDDSLDAGVISSAHNGVAWTPTLLNPNGGNVGVAKTAPQFPLDVGGIVGATGLYGFQQPSSSAVQQDIFARDRHRILVQDFGAAGSSATTTGTGASGRNTITLADASSFSNGNGLRILGSGATFTAAQVSGITSSIVGPTGSTTYHYYLSSIDYNGGIGPAVSFTVANGPDAKTYTSGGTTYTFYNTTQNYIQLNLTQGSGSSGYVIWRAIGAGSPTLYSIGLGSVWKDQGMGWITYGGSSSWLGPDYLPANPPSQAVNDWLTATITGIAGNTISLSANLQQAASGALVYHDDTAAFNAASAYAGSVGGGMIGVPCGNYPLSYSVAISQNYVGFIGDGMCSLLVAYGSGFDFNAPNASVSAQQRGNVVSNLYIVDRNKTTGWTINATNTYNFTFSNLQVDLPPLGFSFLNANTVNVSNVDVNGGPRAWGGIGFRMLSDATNYACCLNAYNFYIHGNGWYIGGPSSVGGREKIGYQFDGNVATIYALTTAVSDIEGVGFLVHNDTGNSQYPYYITCYSCSTEFSTDRAVDIVSGSDVYFTDSTITGAQNGSINFIAETGSKNVVLKGGKSSNAGCRGVDFEGVGGQITGGMLIGNNSTPAAGGTNGACPGVVLGASSRATNINGAIIGDVDNPTVQSYPVLIVNGADAFSVTGNTFTGNSTNCVSNGTTGATSRVVANNAGSC